MEIKGYVFGWSAPTYVNAQQFEAASRLAGGFDRTYVSNYHAKNYIDRVRAVLHELGIYSADTYRLFLRKLQREGSVFRYAIVRERLHSDPVEETVVVVFKLGGEIGVEYVHPQLQSGRDRLEQALFDVLHHVCTASVAARMVRNIVDRGAVPLRKGGGAYFVPAAIPDVLDYVESVISALGGTVMKFGVTGMEFELETIFDAFRESFHMAVNELRRRALEAKQQKTLDRIAGEFTELMQIAEVYRGILEGYQGQLDAIIETAKRGILSAVGIEHTHGDNGRSERAVQHEPALVTNVFEV